MFARKVPECHQIQRRSQNSPHVNDANLVTVALALFITTCLARPQIVTFSGIQTVDPIDPSEAPVEIVKDESPHPVPNKPNVSSSNTKTSSITVGCTLGGLAILFIVIIVVYRRHRTKAREEREKVSHCPIKSTTRTSGTPPPYRVSRLGIGNRVQRPERTLSKEWTMGTKILVPAIMGSMDPELNTVEMKVSVGSREAEEALWQEIDRMLRTPPKVKSEETTNIEVRTLNDYGGGTTRINNWI